MTRRAWAALATVYVVWGSTYLAIMVAIRTLPPFLMSSARYLVAGAVLYAFAVRRGAPRPALRHWRSAVVAGAALLLVGNGGVAWSEQRVDSGVAALLIATVPLWIALFDRVFGGRRLARAGLLGLVIGLGRVPAPVGPGGGADVHRLDLRLRQPSDRSWARRGVPRRAADASSPGRERSDRRLGRPDRDRPRASRAGAESTAGAAPRSSLRLGTLGFVKSFSLRSRRLRPGG